ncbi:guanine nucleotide-binding protein beta subunit [Capsaspora owczarzaki ATCC 30864]|uniref:Guanine nucleotide-binding protein beta subunit n=1 Tax=Capsaspora owczarzaki (strain ATCC 30864) TaxID=595528 RepID=A0A0D2U807_CAPO3|nr:guanine nucleotide-binding protein beta subunit [Capsaspora owczarzaki ATCC 30864]KJE91226.1 guanine nucleotide-binding protein beta subunit [Capsaspora owczarzaki ATCC 30864]|eukprot:XP_004349142.1 guanine nucleotide-binding protein beta subunit [Capsaspora owczarzaki ATCC 30864]
MAMLQQQLQTEINELKGRLAIVKKEFEDTTVKQLAQKTKEVGRIQLKNRRTLKGHLAKVYAMQWANDRRRIVSAAQDGKLIIWDAFKMHKHHAIALRSSWVMTCAYSPSGQFVACGGLDNVCTLYSIREGEDARIYRTLSGHDGFISCCRFLPNERQIITASGDATCVLWDIETGERLKAFTGHAGECLSVNVSPDGSTFVSGSSDGTCRIWDVRSGRCVQWFNGHESDVNAVVYFPNGEAFGSGSDDDTCRLFDLRADQQIMQYSRDVIMAGVTSIDFSMSGRLLFAGHDDFQVNVWDTLRGERVALLDAHEHQVSCLGVSSDGAALATGSWDSYLKVWA